MSLEVFQPIREVHIGNGSQGRFLLGDVLEKGNQLLPEYSGRVKLIYLDPPFATGDTFVMRVKLGQEGWRSGKSALSVKTFHDSSDLESFLSMMKKVLMLCREFLRDDGMIFVHMDWRVHAHMRLMMDDIFGSSNFMNDIVWVYQTGGRAVKHFSRKHDNILFYRKSPACDFNVDEVKTPPAEPRSNHMRRHVDPDGRIYRSINSNGRIYTYYDDDPVAPSDVWSDLHHLQQRDPERTGYDTQKPLVLLDRIVRCGSRKGELVMDLFAGSSTTLEAAKRLERDFIGIDNCPLTAGLARRRLCGSQYSIEPIPPDYIPRANVTVNAGIGFYHITLDEFDIGDIAGRTLDGLDAADNWSVGFLRDGDYTVMDEFWRTRRWPEFKRTLDLPVFTGEPAICVGDVLGGSHYFRIIDNEIHLQSRVLGA